MFLNKYFKLIPITIICTAIIFTQSCNPLTSDWTYTLKGRILKDCSMKPLTNYSVNFYIPSSAIGQGLDDLGTVITDENGYFELKNIPNAHSKHINMKHDIDGSTVTTWGSFSVPQSLINQEDNGVFEMGEFYENAIVNTVVVLNIDSSQFGPMDTLYIGLDPSSYKAVFPIPQKYVYLNSISSSTSIPFVPEYGAFSSIWEIGKASYDSLYHSNINRNSIESNFKLCTYPDTTYYSIP